MPFVPTSPPPNMPTGTEIFERAESVWHTQKIPQYVEFTTYIAAISADPVRVALRTSDGKAFVQTMPLGPKAQPVVYPGVNLSGPGYSPLGICVSQVRCVGVLFPDPFGGTTTPAPEPLKTIAKARVFVNPYQVVNVQPMDFDGTLVYDLKVQPLQDPERYRMRELVIDAQTYHVWKLMYVEPDYPDRLLTYGFGPVENLWYLRQSCHSVVTRLSGLAVPACTPEVAMMWDYEFPTQLPDFYFDRTLYIQRTTAAHN